MNDRYEFYLRGKKELAEPFHYKGSGLPNVYLHSGVTIKDDPEHGRLIRIEKLPQLFYAIAFRLVLKREPLTGAEFRFLRKRMEMTQAELAKELSVSDQTVANYEKQKTANLGPADPAIRMFYLAHVADDDDLAQELRFAAEELMKPSKRKNPDDLAQVVPWLTAC